MRTDAPTLADAFGRVAIVVRGVGAVWMVALTGVYGLTGQLDRPGIAAAMTALGVAWAAGLATSGHLARADGTQWWLVVADLLIVAAILIVPAVAGETAAYVGGYAFAALVVALAAGGRAGVWGAVAALSASVTASLVLVGAEIGPFVVGQILLYVFGAVAMLAGVDVLRRGEQRARHAEAKLAVASERAETAAHLHDSVLQTLVLVHRRAGEPAEVRRLVRQQERDLRRWLFGGHGEGATDPTLEAALATITDRIELDHGLTVTTVISAGAGGLPADPHRSLLAAAHEALINAAIHAEVRSADVFVTVEEEEVVVFVRDRGVGFDADAIPPDRQGLRGSIIDRVQRAGGAVRVSTAPGRGTEIELRHPTSPNEDSIDKDRP